MRKIRSLQIDRLYDRVVLTAMIASRKTKATINYADCSSSSIGEDEDRDEAVVTPPFSSQTKRRDRVQHEMNCYAWRSTIWVFEYARKIKRRTRCKHQSPLNNSKEG